MAASVNKLLKCWQAGRSAACRAAVSLLVATACDPNVVIGAKWSLTAGGTADGSAGGVTLAPAAAGGNAGTDSTGASGDANESAGEASAAGSGGSLLFEARHETDLAEWTEGGPENGSYYADDDRPFVASEQVHSGKSAIKIQIDTSGGRAPICRLYRRVPAPSAYYGAWFYVVEDHVSSQWWTLMLFRAQPDVNDAGSAQNLWDLGLFRSEGDYTSFEFYDHERGQDTLASGLPALPIGRWFHLEARLAHGLGLPTTLEFWLDGVSILRLTDLNEAPRSPIFWSVGNGGSELAPPQSTLFIDDATISTVRVGP